MTDVTSPTPLSSYELGAEDSSDPLSWAILMRDNVRKELLDHPHEITRNAVWDIFGVIDKLIAVVQAQRETIATLTGSPEGSGDTS